MSRRRQSSLERVNLKDEERVVFEVAQLASELRSIARRLERRIRERAVLDELTLSQETALARLGCEGPLTVSAVARSEGVRSQTMSATMTTLKRSGLVATRPNPDDRRESILCLTAAGAAQVAKCLRRQECWLTRTIDRELSGEKQQQIHEAIKLLHRLFDSDS